jgi:peptidase S41-like protein/PDZ domain-containing protein
MKKLSTFALFLCLSSGARAQLTPSQKVNDFSSLVALYNRNYAPYEWRRDTFGFDLLNVKPWLDQVNASKDDLSFYDICVRYVASLQDSHDEFILPSDFEAFLDGLFVDIYDGKVLIDFVDRSVLPTRTYPFQVGDELVSVDGTSVAEWITALQPYAVNASANPVSRNRIAASTIIDRYQGWYTFANKIGDSATIQVRRQNGNVETYTITWTTFGTPLISEGPLPSPRATSAAREVSTLSHGSATPKYERRLADDNPWGIWTGPRPEPEIRRVPKYMAPLERLQTMRATEPSHPVAGSIAPFGSPVPAFNPPAGFRLRLGARSTDVFLSGTFPVGKLNIGFIRIPDMAPPSQNTAVNQFLGEITFFQANTDGLVIDVMGNGGGSLCYTETLTSLLIPTPHRTLPLQLRATKNWVLTFSGSIVLAQFAGAPQWVIDVYKAYLAEIQQALSENRGMTGPLPLCGLSFENVPPARDSRGTNLAFTKPIVVLTDNFTLSAGETFTAILQDAQRVTVYGTRTDGGGGNVQGFDVALNSEGFARVTESLIIRAKPISSPGLPSAPFIENIGIIPDVEADLMTVDNLKNGGLTFVIGLSNLISNLVTLGHP